MKNLSLFWVRGVIVLTVTTLFWSVMINAFAQTSTTTQSATESTPDVVLTTLALRTRLAAVTPIVTALSTPTSTPTPTLTPAPIRSMLTLKMLTITATLSTQLVETTIPTLAITSTNLPAVITSAIQSIHQRGYLVAGVRADIPLFGYRDDDGNWSGFEIDLMREFAKRWLDDETAIEFTAVTPQDRLERLANGDVDILAAAVAHTKEREKTIDYSQSYYLDGQNILVLENAASWSNDTLDTDDERIQWLRGKRIASLKNSLPLQRIKDFNLEKGLNMTVEEFEKYDQAVQALLDGEIDAITTIQGILLGLQTTNSSLMILLEQNFSKDPYGLGVRSGDFYFADLVNYTLQELKSDSTYDSLYAKWFCKDETRDCKPYQIELWPGVAPYTFTTAPTMTIELTRSSAIDKMLERGFFIAGVKKDSAPFGYSNEANEFVGFEIDLMREFARRWLGDVKAVEFLKVTSQDRIPNLINGNIDIIAATMTHTKDRDQQIDFSQTYYLDGQNILVREGEDWRSSDNDESRIQALNGKRMGAIQGSTSIRQIDEFTETYGIKLSVAKFEQYDQAVQALLDGNVDGLTTDRGILIGFAQKYPELVVLLDNNFNDLSDKFQNENYGIGILNGDHRFRDLVNFTLQEMKQDGTYDLLYRYWFGINFIMQDETLNEDEKYDIIKRYWVDDTQNPVDMSLPMRKSWQPYPIEIWPGVNYFSGSGSVHNDLAPMVLVPAGRSRLGTTSDRIQDVSQHSGRGNAQLIVEVDPFYIDQHEVTNHQYRQCVELEKCTLPQKLGILNVAEYFYGRQYQEHPVVHVTWEQAQQYCSAFGKTLPTEAQWEKAARYNRELTEDIQYMYPWGDDGSETELRATYADSVDRQEFANPVGIYRYSIPSTIHGFSEPVISLSGASPLDVLDMAGNVQEWTADCYVQGFYQELILRGQEAPRNPNGCELSQSANRTVRSSGYYDSKYTLLTIYRQGKPANSDDLLRGFRCAMPMDRKPEDRLIAAP
jgi:ABC-type amino acid transport substrate-binding protein/formylglycine-generating enzyme required for sulfatase activity